MRKSPNDPESTAGASPSRAEFEDAFVPGTPRSAEKHEHLKDEVLGDGGKIIAGEMHVSQTTWSGPLPDPDSFNRYSDDVRGRIMTLAEKESEHRHGCERRAQHYAFIALLFVVLLSGVLVLTGNPYGLLVLVGGLVPVLGAFLEKLKELFSSDKRDGGDEHSR